MSVGVTLLCGCPREQIIPEAAPVPSGVSSGPAPVRLLSRQELANTVRDLFGTNEAAELAMTLPPEAEVLGFDNNADARSVGALRSERLMALAEDLSALAVADLDAHLPCGSGDRSAQCAHGFLSHFGGRAFRRPLEPDEIARYGALLDETLEADGFERAIGLLIQAFLQSPHFLYRLEFGLPGTETAGQVRLTAHEMASRLSYFLWGTMPDDGLLLTADQGLLVTAEQVEGEARRMLDYHRSRDMLGHFESQWLLLNRMPFTTHIELQWQMVMETERFFEEVLFADDRRLSTLLTAPWTLVNLDLADHYGLAPPDGADDGEGFVRVELDPARRSGFLTHAGILGVHARPAPEILKAPIRRGRFVREQLLCEPVSPPPPGLEIPFIDLEASEPLTAREHLALHVGDPSCAGCHDLMEPIGFAFDAFDARGLWREVDEQGLPTDSAGELMGTVDVDGPVHGARDLAERLATSTQVAECTVRQWFRFAFGRVATGEDAATLAWLNERFQASDGDVYELIIDLTRSDPFLYRPAVSGVSP